MTIELVLALMAFALVTSITPGPNNLMLMTSGINFGFKRTIPHMTGVAIGFTVMMALIGLGLQEIFNLFPPFYMILKVISVVFLGYLAWKIATTSPTKEQDKSASKPMSFVQAAAFQWVNPKAWIMAVSAIGTYTPSEGTLWSILWVSLIFGLINFPSVSVWVCIGTQLKRFLQHPVHLRAFNICAALLLILSLYPVLTTSNF